MICGFQRSFETRPAAASAGVTGPAAASAAAPSHRLTATEENPSAVAKLMEEWSVVREAVARMVIQMPGAQAKFFQAMEELSGKVYSAEWETLFL